MWNDSIVGVFHGRKYIHSSQNTYHIVNGIILWSQCFAQTIGQEDGLKPWSHTTALGEEDFPNMVLDNKVGGRCD